MPDMTPAHAQRLAINVRRGTPRSRRLPSGAAIDSSTADLLAHAAETLHAVVADLRDHALRPPAGGGTAA